jgi:HNH endonuclease
MNVYRIDGDVVRINVWHGSESLWAVVDAADIEKVLSSGAHWVVKGDRNPGIFGIVRGEVTSLHRFLAGFPDGMDVIHKDGDWLNNRRGNLEVVSRRERMRRRWPKDWEERDRAVAAAREKSERLRKLRVVREETGYSRAYVHAVLTGKKHNAEIERRLDEQGVPRATVGAVAAPVQPWRNVP